MANEIGVRLTGDASQFRSTLRQAEREASKFGSSLGKRLFDARSLGTSLATALGLNIQNIAEGVARLATGVSKEEEANLKRLADLSTQIADRNIANNKKRLSDEQQYQLALLEQERINRRIADNRGKTSAEIAKRMEDELALANSIAESDALSLKIRQEKAKEQDRIAKMLEGAKKQAAEGDKRFAEEVQRGLERSVALDEEINRQRTESLPLEERLLALEKEKRELIEVQKLAVKGSNDYKELQIRINDQNLAIEKTQAEIAERKLRAEEATVAALEEQEAVQIRIVGRGQKDLSDRELDRKINTLKKAIAQGQTGLAARPSGVGNLSGYDPLLSMQQVDLQKAIEERQLRERTRRSVAILGEERAFARSGLSEQRFTDIIRGTEESVKLLREIRDQQRNGLRVLPMQPPGGVPNG